MSSRATCCACASEASTHTWICNTCAALPHIKRFVRRLAQGWMPLRVACDDGGPNVNDTVDVSSCVLVAGPFRASRLPFRLRVSGG